MSLINLKNFNSTKKFLKNEHKKSRRGESAAAGIAATSSRRVQAEKAANKN